MPRSSTGEKLPLVTSPDALVPRPDGVAGRGESGARRARGRAAGGATPRSRSAASGPRPRKSPLSNRTTQPSPAWSGVMPGPSSWPCSGKPGFEPQRVAGAEPGREDAGAEEAPPARRRARARARGARRRPRRCSRCRRPSPARRRRRPAAPRSAATVGPSPGATRASPCARVGPLDREHGSGRGDVVDRALAVGVDAAASSRAATSGAVFDAFGITRNSSSPTHHTMMSSTTCASSGSSRCVYCARPGAIRVEVVGERPLQQSKRARRLRRARSRGATRRTTTACSRQARCSSSTLVYWIGMSQPPNGDHARAERAVLGVEGAVPQRRGRRRPRRSLGRLASGRLGPGWRGPAAQSEPSSRSGAPSPSCSLSCDGGSSPYFTSRCR